MKKNSKEFREHLKRIGFKKGKDNLAKKPEIREKISKAQLGKHKWINKK